MSVVLLTIQYISILAVLVAIFVLAKSKSSQNQTILLLIFSSNLINQLGTALSMQASSLDGALTGLKMAYYGKICVIFFILIFTLNYCGKPLKPWVQIVLNIIQATILVAVFSCEYHNLYYTSIEYVTDGVIPHLKTTAGPLHHVFLLLLVSYMGIIVIVCFWKLQELDDKKEKERVACLFVIPIIILISYTIYKCGLTRGYDCTSIALVIDTAIIVYALRRLDLIDYLAKAKEELVDEFSDAVLVLDDKGNPVYFNKQTEVLFPDIVTDSVDKVISKISSKYEENGELWIDKNLFTIRKKEQIEKDTVRSTIYTLTDNTSDFILTYVDVLTDVKNRRALVREFENLNKTANQWFVMMDVDNFKNINDTKGHQEGDQCLVDFAKCLADTFGLESVFRFGGDEFIVIVSCSEDLLIKKLDKVNSFLSDESREYPFHISGGYTKIETELPFETIMAEADKALYEAKRAGKGRFIKA